LCLSQREKQHNTTATTGIKKNVKADPVAFPGERPQNHAFFKRKR
jgi:hypothetical protein